MSGICGFWFKEKQISTGAILKMNSAIRHRGKDDEGYCFLNNKKLEFAAGNDSINSAKNSSPSLPLEVKTNLCFGFRSSFVNNGSINFHQPYYNKRNDSCITFDGTIFNSASIRKELTEKGYEFPEMSDAEVILTGYQHWGIEIINRLNGAFAIALYDNHCKKLWLIRDRLGIKTFFYSRTPDGIVWASEIKSVLQNPLVKHELFETGLIANYYLQATPNPFTCFKDIFAVSPAHYIEIDLNNLAVNEKAYWSLNQNRTSLKYKFEDAVAELEERLFNSIKLRVTKGDPVISLMSGGIDSTTLTAIAHQIRPSLSCYSFAIDGTGTELDELPQAIKMAQKLGIQQIVQHLKQEDMIEDMDRNIRHFEAPYSSIEIVLLPSRLLSAGGFKTMLYGNGGDEIFGGPHYYLEMTSWKKLRYLSFMSPLIPPAGTFLTKVKNVLELNTMAKFYANKRLAMRPYQIRQLIPKVKKEKFEEIIDWLQSDVKGDKSNFWDILFQIEIKHSFGAHHSFRDGLSASKYGMEFSYPYLDHTLVEWVYSLPPEFRFSNKITKPLLRAVAEKFILKENLNMPKKGFGVPVLPYWHSSPSFREYMEMNLTKLKKRKIYNNRVIDQWAENPRNDFEMAKIFQLVTTEVWMEEHLD